MSKQNIIAQGAEAIILLDKNEIIKDRVSKKYRHPLLDKKIIQSRTKKEAKLLEKASEIINSPKPIFISSNQIRMPHIEGKKLSEKLEKLDWKEICKIIGQQIAKLHDSNIIHGDLTTSNMIWVDNLNATKNPASANKEKPSKDMTINNKNKSNNRARGDCEQKIEPKLFFIDFGLGYTSNKIEDRAVDLHLIKQALEAKHFSIYKEAEKIILENYNSKDKAKVLEQLKKVEARGRYKH